jgi:thiamine biosynthesis lipoprotein
MEAESDFRAMGSDAHVIVVGGHPGLVKEAQGRIDDLERRWSRFLGDSETCELTRRAGHFVTVSPDTVLLVQRAIDAFRLTGGAFDPTVLGDLIRAGYDRSFDLLGADPRPGYSLLEIGAADITIDGSRVRLPPGTGFDPGGIGKGLAADIVCAEMIDGGARGVCVNLGGDVRVRGAGPDGQAWTVGVEHPWSDAPLALVGLAEGAVATSTTLRRRWEIDGQSRQHLIDPQTGLPSETDVTLATVIAAEGWMAEVLAKAVVLAGSVHPFDLLGGTGAEALAVDASGQIQSTPGLATYLGNAVLPAGIRREGGANSRRWPDTGSAGRC